MSAITEDRVPLATDAERAVLGGILVSGNGALEKCLRILEPDDMQAPHAAIFRAMVDLHQQRAPVDPVLLNAQLSRRGDLAAVGGPAYVASLMDGVSHSSNVEYYAQLVKEAADRRAEIAAAYQRIDGAAEPGQEAATGGRPTDVSNAERFVRLYGADLRYCWPQNRWLHWDSARWAADDTGRVHQLAKRTVAAMYAEAAADEDNERRKALAKHAAKSEGEARINAIVSLARSEPTIPVRPQELDADPWLFNLANGTLDLKTGTLRPHRRRDLITKIAACDYDASAGCPAWEAFMDRILGGNADLVAFLRRAAGYVLTGDTSEHALFVLYGSGANGKSTFMNVLLHLLGDYGQKAAADLFMARRRDQHPTGIADLQGARLVAGAETEDGQLLAEGLMKDLTGGDRVRARHLYTKNFEFVPAFKLFLATNHRPVVRDPSHAMWRRIRLVPFTITIPPGEQDKHLFERLRDESPGILAWAVRGCLEWQAQGLGTAPDVEAATAQYRAESDTLGEFLDECCTVAPDARVAKDHLFKRYTEWAEANRESRLSKRGFGGQLVGRGITEGRSNTVRWWQGIGLPGSPMVTQ